MPASNAVERRCVQEQRPRDHAANYLAPDRLVAARKADQMTAVSSLSTTSPM
jgi:hypothetical protein